MTRRPSHGRRRRRRRGARGDGGTGDARRRRIVFWAQVLGALFGAIGAAAAVVALVPSGWLGGSNASEPRVRPEGRLELEQVVLRNGQPVYRDGPADTVSAVQTTASLPTIGVTLLNGTRHRVLVTDVHVAIEAYARFRICYTQGGGPVPVGGRYAIELPERPLPSERAFATPLQPPRQLGPDEADRIELRFKVDDHGMDSDHLYAIRVRLRTSDDESIEVGRFVVALPGAYVGFGDLPRGHDVLAQDWLTDDQRLAITWCYHRHLTDMRRMLAQRGERSPEVAALDDAPLGPWWETGRVRTPARLAAPRLLRADEPVLAVLAAERSGDGDLLARTRDDGVDALLERARNLADDGSWLLSVDALRDALALAPSHEAEELLAEATRQADEEARRWAEERREADVAP